MFTRGNSKLGSKVLSFGIPAGKTCPGATAACARVCYAKHGRYRTDTVKASTVDKLALTKRTHFVPAAVVELAEKGAKLVRIHTSGDFYSAPYVRAWIKICKDSPDTTFWAYTRSWRVPAMRPALKALAALPNVALWFSADVDSGLPGAVPDRVKVAWLQLEHDEPVPDGVGLVFRSRRARKVIAKVVSGAPVCPVETGLPGAHNTTCFKCRKCYGSALTERTSGRVSLPVLSV